MYCCERHCGSHAGRTLYWTSPKASCPYCGGKVIRDEDDRQIAFGSNKIYFHNRWNARVMDVGIDRIYCPTKQDYLDACKHARVMRPGVGGWEYTEIIPAGVMDG